VVTIQDARPSNVDAVRKLLKLLHEIGAVGVVGSFAACLILVAHAPAPSRSLVAYAAVRQDIASITRWLLVPSLALVLISGLLAIAAHDGYKNAAWAWMKALLGISMFEGTLLTVGAGARRAAELSALPVSGRVNGAQLAQILHGEWGGLWLLLGLSIVNIILAVWRPRLYRRQTA
jgi:hypothetical protein